MEIKRIQLRGISRSPSDRMTDDGGVAESLNAQILDKEIAPICEPKSCHEDFGLAHEVAGDEPIFIHKTSAYEHIIVYNPIGGSISYLKDGVAKSFLTIKGLLKNIISLGNTLIVTHDQGVAYALFRDGKYVEISLNEDSLPKLSFVNVCVPAGGKGGVSYDVWQYDDFTGEYGVYAEGDPENDYLVEGDKKLELAGKIWESYRSMIDNNLTLGCFSQPVMIRYGIRLYDGSYLWVSSPIMLGSCLPKTNESYIPFGNFDDFHSPLNAFTASRYEDMVSKTVVQLASPYRIGVNVHRAAQLSQLKDIISSIDVFISNPIDFYPNGRDHIKGESADDVYDDYWTYCKKYTLDPINSEDPKKIEEAILSASNFFLVKSYNIDGLPEETDVLNDNFQGENLFIKPTLDDDKVVVPIAQASAIATYNGRFLAGGIDEFFSRGNGVLNGQCANPYEFLSSETTDVITYGFAFHVPSANVVVKDYDAKKSNKSASITPDSGKAAFSNRVIKDVVSTPYAWISHPNPNCTKVTVRVYSNGYPFCTYNLDMKPHPYLPCSYAFLGIGERIFREGSSVQDDFDSYDDMPVISKQNVAAMSNIDNPFVFAPSAKMSLNDKIKGFATATEPMSTGQFGQFPIYFFLDDGIWTITLASDGNFGSTPVLVSRDVCSNPNTITPSKNTIFFMSDRGLLAISGRDVECLSEHMYGRPYVIPQHIIDMIDNAGYDGLIGSDYVEYFKDFMNRPETKITYDYVGQRLICFNTLLEYQYIFSIKTNTWHRAKYGKMNRPLNAYPRCVVTTKDSRRVGSMIVTTYGLLDISLYYDEDSTAKKIALATRPFDLAEPDVFKTIKDVRVRGQFPKGAVKFILLGSNDGINFSVINTLRGKSWKLFRLIILADLDPTDRISWVDVGYETRFTNKLR